MRLTGRVWGVGAFDADWLSAKIWLRLIVLRFVSDATAAQVGAVRDARVISFAPKAPRCADCEFTFPLIGS